MPKIAKVIAKRYNKQLELPFDYSESEGKYLIKGYDHTNRNFIITEKGIEGAIWGLIPFWSKPDYVELIKKKNRNVNAREDGIFKKSSFRVPIDKRRCLIPASGFFEYHYLNKQDKEVYYIYVKDMDIYSFAGIYDIWHDIQTGQHTISYSIITCPSNELMSFIHNGGKNPFRMPVILSEKDEQIWLDGKSEHKILEKLMVPFPSNLMDAYVLKINSKDFQISQSRNSNILL